ncbi:hypothetical protein J6590_092179 [Homalodisca vitripennis]|nr:hypothetical protein J6590_092179 [Homalodisca vitripennis]
MRINAAYKKSDDLQERDGLRDVVAMLSSAHYHELFKRYARRPLKWRKRTTPYLPLSLPTTPFPLPTTLSTESNEVWWTVPEVRVLGVNRTTTWEEPVSEAVDHGLMMENTTNLTIDLGTNLTLARGDEQVELAIMVATALVLGLIILATVIAPQENPTRTHSPIASRTLALVSEGELDRIVKQLPAK